MKRWHKSWTLALLSAFITNTLIFCAPTIDSTRIAFSYPAILDPAPIAKDNKQHVSDSAFMEAERLRLQGTKDALRLALGKYEESLNLCRKSGDHVGEAIVLNAIGLTFLDLGESQKALEYYRLALPILQDIKDERGLAENFTNTGGVYHLLGEEKKAIEFFQRALLLWMSLSDRQAMAQTLKNIGATYYILASSEKIGDISNLENALVFTQHARNMWMTIGYKKEEIESIAIINKIFALYKEKFKAARNSNYVLPLTNSLCRAFYIVNQKGKGEGCFNAYAKLYASVFDYSNMKSTLDDQGRDYILNGQTLSAHETFYQANTIPPKNVILGGALMSIGLTYIWMGEYQKALEYLNRSNNSNRAEINYTNIGFIYNLLGDPQQAIYYYEKALPKLRGTRSQFNRVLTLVAMGFAHYSLNNYTKALEYYLQAMPIVNKFKDRVPRYAGLALGGIGLIYIALGDHQQALSSLHQALEMIRKSQDRFFESVCLANLALVLDKMGNEQQALNYYQQARLVSQLAADPKGEGAALYGLAYIQSRQGKLFQARDLVKLAIEKVETIRANTPGQRLRYTFFSSVQAYYALYIDILMRLHRLYPSEGYNVTALQANESARARSLLDLINESKIDFQQAGDQKLLEREQMLQQQLSVKAEEHLKSLIGIETKSDAKTLESELDELSSAYQDIQARIVATSTINRALAQSQPLSLKEIQQSVLDSDTLLLEYSLGEDRSYLWAVSQSSIISFELPGRVEIESAAMSFYRRIGERHKSYKTGQSDRELSVANSAGSRTKDENSALLLSNVLLKPVSSILRDKRLLIVADGALQYIPFAALPDPEGDQASRDNKKLLIVNHEIVSLPSASIIEALRNKLASRQPALKTIAVLADPVFEKNDERVHESKLKNKSKDDLNSSSEERGLMIKKASSEAGITNLDQRIPRLPGTRREAEKIVALVAPDQAIKALDFAASRTTATNPELRNYRFIHFATHGLVNSIHPELSGVLLSLVDERGEAQNGFLQAHELYNLNLGADLVVLSACQTALGADIRGEGLIGLLRGFLYSGAGGVVATLWQVDDDATADLMVNFYTRILKEGLRPAAALRAAQIEMLNDNRLNDPYYWAPFVLQGEWR